MVEAEFVLRILRELKQRQGALSAAEAARLADRSASRVRHVFTLMTGMTFRTACFQARLAPACNFLANTQLTISEISAALRYSDRSKFERAFKRLYGVTPAQYRLDHQGR